MRRRELVRLNPMEYLDSICPTSMSFDTKGYLIDGTNCRRRLRLKFPRVHLSKIANLTYSKKEGIRKIIEMPRPGHPSYFSRFPVPSQSSTLMLLYPEVILKIFYEDELSSTMPGQSGLLDSKDIGLKSRTELEHDAASSNNKKKTSLSQSDNVKVHQKILAILSRYAHFSPKALVPCEICKSFYLICKLYQHISAAHKSYILNQINSSVDR